MRRKDNKKSYIYAAICFVIIVLICVIFFVKNVSGNMKVLVAKQDIVKGKIISEEEIDELFMLDDAGQEENEEYLVNTTGLAGMIVTSDIKSGSAVTSNMISDEYEPISRLKSPIVIGIHASEPSQFVSGIVRPGDTVNISVIDSLTNECTDVLNNVYVCGAYNDDGTEAIEGDCAMNLNILIDKSDEGIINRLITKGTIRISKAGSGLND